MSYKWRWEEGLDLSELPGRIIDYSFIREEDFFLLVLLSDEGDVYILYSVGDVPPKYHTASIKKITPYWTEAVLITLLPDASGVVLLLSRGKFILVPIKALIDVPWGGVSAVTYKCTVFGEIDATPGSYLDVPTSLLCCNALYSSRPFLIYGNKAGKVNIVDLGIKKVSAGLSGPQSISRLERFVAGDDAYLIVTGFTGAQWIIPLETDGKSIRETLIQLIPSELDVLRPSCSHLSCTHSGLLCQLNTNQNTVQLFDDISLKHMVAEFCVPSGSWRVCCSDNAIFVVCDQSTVRIGTHFGIFSSFTDLFYDDLDADLSEHDILGIIPFDGKDGLPVCLIVTQNGVIRISTKKSRNEVIVDFLMHRHFNLKICQKICDRLHIELPELGSLACELTLKRMKSEMKFDQSVIDELLQLIVDVPVNLTEAFRIFSYYEMSYVLLPLSLDCSKRNPADNVRHLILDMFISKYLKFPSQKKDIEEDICIFLAENTDIVSGVEQLMENSLWRCVIPLASRTQMNSEAVTKFLTESSNEWHSDWLPFIAKILTRIQWGSSSADKEVRLLQRICRCLPRLESLSHLSLFASTGEKLLNKYPEAARSLYCLSSLRLLSSISGMISLGSIVSCGSNCTAIVSENDDVVFWGSFTAGSLKLRETDRERVAKAADSALPRTIYIPEKICSVSCGTEHVLCVTVQGHVYAWGKNRYGECGLGHTKNVEDAQQVKGPWQGVRCLRAGHYHSALVDLNGHVFTWGWAIHGQLGYEGPTQTENICSPRRLQSIDEPIASVACGYAHTIFLTESGKVMACGNGGYGQLGCGVEQRKRYHPELVPVPEKVVKISSKYFHCLALSESQQLYQWGSNPSTLKLRMFLAKRFRAPTKEAASRSPSDSNDLNLSEKHQEPLVVDQSHLRVTRIEHMVDGVIVDLDAGYNHSALRTSDGALYTWGKGLEMQLGHGNKKEQEEPHRVFKPANIVWDSVSCGLDFTVASSSSGDIYVWGRNDRGCLGVQCSKEPTSTRKIVIKGIKGARSIQIAGDSPTVAFPTKLSGVYVSTLSSNLNVDETLLISTLRRCSFQVISDIVSSLQENDVPCYPTVYLYLLAGYIRPAINTFSCLTEGRSPTSCSLLDTLSVADASEYSDENIHSALLRILWRKLLNYPCFSTLWNAISCLLEKYPVDDGIVQNRRLSLGAPVILIGNPNLLAKMTAENKAAIIEKWQPGADTQPALNISQQNAQNTGGRIRHWNCCDSVEVVPNNQNDAHTVSPRRVCERCVAKWKQSVRSRLQ